MLNQVIIVGRVSTLEEKVVDNGTHAVVLTLDVDGQLIPIWSRDELATFMLNVNKGIVIAIKGRIHMSPDGMTLVAERASFLSEGLKK